MKRILISLLAIVVLTSANADAFFGKKKKKPLVYLTAQELAEYNGVAGQPLYVAVEGKIYDLTKCRYWKNGIHEKSPEDAIGGKDLTEVLKTSKHGAKRVLRYPHVGFLVESKEDIPVEAGTE